MISVTNSDLPINLRLSRKRVPPLLETQHTHSSHAPPIIFITFILLLLLLLEVNSNFNIFQYKLLSRFFINTSNKSSLAAQSLCTAIISNETQLIKTHQRMPTRNTVDKNTSQNANTKHSWSENANHQNVVSIPLQPISPQCSQTPPLVSNLGWG